MGMHLLRIIKLVLLLPALLVFTACGGGGGGSAPYISIDNESLSSVLKVGDQEQGFPGVTSFIDTKVVFQGSDMFLGLTIDSAVKALITKNVNSFLETSPPVFDSGPSPSSTGVTVDAALKKITVALSEMDGAQTNANIIISWSFTGNSVVRSYTKTYVDGELKGTTYSSTWTYSYSSVTGLTTALFIESINETKLLPSGKTLTKKASYNGTVKFVRSTVDGSLVSLASADYSQLHTETNNDTALTWTLDGSVKMTGTTLTGGKLSFDGGFSFDIPSYKTVTGKAVLTDGAYLNNAILNSTADIIDPDNLTLTSQADYSDYTSTTNNASALRGAWVGTFTDSCGVNPGNIELSITETTATWFGMSSDLSRVYGTLISIDATGLHLKNNALSWGNSSNVNNTTIDGIWSFDGCSGNFSVTKQ
ncbi:MAG: hypothetical protein WC156_02985 [Pedobacter sp.]